MTNRKLHMRYRLVLRSMTFDDLERPFRTLFQNTCDCGAHHENLNEGIVPYCQRQRCSAMTVVSDNIGLYGYSRGLLADKASNDSGVIENVDFQGFRTLHLRHLRKWGQHYYIVLFSPLSPFLWLQNRWPWMTFNGHYTLNFHCSEFTNLFYILTVEPICVMWPARCVEADRDPQNIWDPRNFGRTADLW